MIVRERPSAWRLFFVMRGSVLPKVLPQILVAVGLAVAVTAAHEALPALRLSVTPAPFTILGLALSLFLGFRNHVAYDRWWEGRRLWGELLIAARSFARQVEALVAPADTGAARLAERRAAVLEAAAFAHALRHHLRASTPRADLARLLEPAALEAVAGSRHVPRALLRGLGARLRGWLAGGCIGEPAAATLEGTLGTFERVLGGCERLRATPVPFSYTLLLHRTAYLYCLLLPFGLVDTVGLATPAVVGLVSYTFFGLDALGDEIEEPFGCEPNDLPLAALSRTIEIELREALGETELPAPLAARGFQLD